MSGFLVESGLKPSFKLGLVSVKASNQFLEGFLPHRLSAGDHLQ